MKITLRCFASVRELLGEDELALEVPEGTTVDRLRSLLAERAPSKAPGVLKERVARKQLVPVA